VFLEFEVPPWLTVVVRDDLRTMNGKSVVVQLSGHAREITRARGDRLDVEVQYLTKHPRLAVSAA